MNSEQHCLRFVVCDSFGPDVESQAVFALGITYLIDKVHVNAAAGGGQAWISRRRGVYLLDNLARRWKHCRYSLNCIFEALHSEDGQEVVERKVYLNTLRLETGSSKHVQ